MNKKSIVLSIALVISGMIFSQSQKTIKVIVPNKTDEVFITGNQESLGNWNPKSIKMKKISDYERSITTNITFPAEFKFTKGDWNQEGIVKELDNNPNLKLTEENAKAIYNIKGWSNDIDGDALGLGYNVEFLPSKFVKKGRKIQIALPKNYDPARKYPVIYITDGATHNFTTARDYLRIFSEENYKLLPETILVGIVHGRDGQRSQRNIDLDVYYKDNSGKQFKDFLFKELVPYINGKYSTTGFNVMIGHSNGAEFNHFLFLEKDNPFRAFLSISTNFYSKNVRKQMGDFMKNYKGRPIYYFVSTGDEDSPDRTIAGNDYEKIYKENPNKNIFLQKKNYDKGHNSMVPQSLFDGLQFIFKDYNDTKGYKTVAEYRDNYLKDQKYLYGLEEKMSLNDVRDILGDILTNRKDEKDLDDLLAFIKEHKLWSNGYTINGGMDSANEGNFYWMIGSYERSAQKYTNAFENLAITVEPAVYYYNYRKIVDSFKKIAKHNELMSILIQSRNKLSDHPEYLNGNNKVMLLVFNYEIAKLYKEQNINKKEGKRALKYCKENYVKNGYFKKNALDQL